MEKELPVVSETAADGIQAESERTEVKESEKKHPDSVSYEYHKKLLDQRKADRLKMQQKDDLIAEMQRREAEAHEAKLLEEKRFQELYEAEKAGRIEAHEKFTSMESSLLDAHKLAAFREALPGEMASEHYYSFVDLEKIQIDKTNGVVDRETVRAAVNEFVTKHPRLYVPKEQQSSMPNQAPGNYKAKTYEEALKAANSRAELDAVYKQYGKE